MESSLLFCDTKLTHTNITPIITYFIVLRLLIALAMETLAVMVVIHAVF